MKDIRAVSASVARRSLAIVLLGVHLVLFALGGAFAAESTARAAGRQAIVATTSSAGDGAVIVSGTDARFEVGTRSRANGTAGAASLYFFLPKGLPAIGPAGLSGTLDRSTTTRELRPAPCVVNGARGPPAAR